MANSHINSTLMTISVGGTIVGRLTENSFEMGHAPRDITSKDSSGWQEFLEGLRSSSASFTAWMDPDATNSGVKIEDVFDLIETTRTAATILMASTVSASRSYSVSGWLTGITINGAGPEDTVSWSATFTGSGAVTEATIV